MMNSVTVFLTGISGVLFGMLLLYASIKLTFIITDKLIKKND